jgi:hypothetical protein
VRAPRGGSIGRRSSVAAKTRTHDAWAGVAYRRRPFRRCERREKSLLSTPSRTAQAQHAPILPSATEVSRPASGNVTTRAYVLTFALTTGGLFCVAIGE